MLSGFLCIDKPSGVTSRDVVDWVVRRVRPAKAGHAGTLDPLASGVLVVCVGAATRLMEYVQQRPKSYRGVFLLGQTSTTEDVEGQVQLLPAAPIPAREQLERAAAALTGRIMQRPPAYSALKVAGKRAYDLARRGQPVDLAPRPIDIYELRVLRYDYPELELQTLCGAGTYVRTLGRDLAKAAGTDAVMASLVRMAVGEFRLADALPADKIALADLTAWLQPLERAVAHLPSVSLTPAQAQRLRFGQCVPLSPEPPGPTAAGLDGDGKLVAILERQPAGAWHAERAFLPGA